MCMTWELVKRDWGGVTLCGNEILSWRKDGCLIGLKSTHRPPVPFSSVKTEPGCLHSSSSGWFSPVLWRVNSTCFGVKSLAEIRCNLVLFIFWLGLGKRYWYSVWSGQMVQNCAGYASFNPMSYSPGTFKPYTGKKRGWLKQRDVSSVGMLQLLHGCTLKIHFAIWPYQIA